MCKECQRLWDIYTSSSRNMIDLRKYWMQIGKCEDEKGYA